MKGYFMMEPTEDCPLGRLGKIRDGAALLYDPANDRWNLCEHSDTTLFGEGAREGCKSISDEEGDYLKFRLQVAEELTHMFGNNYLDGRNFTHVIKDEK